MPLEPVSQGKWVYRFTIHVYINRYKMYTHLSESNTSIPDHCNTKLNCQQRTWNFSVVSSNKVFSGKIHRENKHHSWNSFYNFQCIKSDGKKKNGLDQAYSNGTRDKCIHFDSLVNTVRIYIVFFFLLYHGNNWIISIEYR